MDTCYFCKRTLTPYIHHKDLYKYECDCHDHNIYLNYLVMYSGSTVERLWLMFCNPPIAIDFKFNLNKMIISNVERNSKTTLIESDLLAKASDILNMPQEKLLNKMKTYITFL